MANQNSSAALFSATHPDIVKRTSIFNLLQSTGLAILGIFLLFFVFTFHDQSSSLNMALMIVGTLMLLYGVFRIFWNSQELVYLPTGSKTSGGSLFFDLKNLPALTNCVEQHRFDEQSGFKSVGNGNVRMDFLLSQDKQFAAIQLFQFIPYTYTPVTSVVYLKGDDAVSASTFLTKGKG